MNYSPILIYLSYALYRLWELVYYSLFNEAEMRKRGAKEYGKGVSTLIKVLFIIIFPAAILEYFLARQALNIYWVGTWSLIIALAALFRFWVIQTLGGRGGYWTVKILIFPGQKLVTRGPYKYFRHPNYFSLIFEILALTLVLKTYFTFFLIFPFYCILIYLRIKEEEKALQETKLKSV